jgi:hypothetical protein
VGDFLAIPNEFPTRISGSSRLPDAILAQFTTTTNSHWRLFMTTTVLNPPMSNQGMTPAQRLRLNSAAVRVSFTWLGVRKTLTPEQRSQAAESFDTM